VRGVVIISNVVISVLCFLSTCVDRIEDSGFCKRMFEGNAVLCFNVKQLKHDYRVLFNKIPCACPV